MGTKANIVIKDEFDCEVWFYRAYDGWPEATMPMLQKLMGWVRDGTLRDTILDTSGWLIVLGVQVAARSRLIPRPQAIQEITPETYGRSVGVVDVTNTRDSDINYLYRMDLTAQTITCYRVNEQEELLFVDAPGEPWTPGKGEADD